MTENYIKNSLKMHTKWVAADLNEGRNNGYNNGYVIKSFDNKCIEVWKEKKHKYYKFLLAVIFTSSIVFQPKKINYFDSHLNKAYNKNNIIQISKNIYY